MDKYIVSVSVTLEISASMPSVAMTKASKKFSKYRVNQIDVYNPDGTDAMTIQPELNKPSYSLTRLPGGR